MFSQVNIFPKALTILDATSEVNNNNAYRHAMEVWLSIILYEYSYIKVPWKVKLTKNMDL